MIKQSRRWTRRGVLVRSGVGVLGTLLLAACAAPAAPTPTTAPAKPAEPTKPAAAAPTEAPKAAAPAQTKAPTPIRFSHWIPNLITKTMPILEQKHNVKITEESAPFGEYFDKLLTQFTGGVAPDLIYMSIIKAGPFYTADLLKPLDKALADRGLDNSKWGMDVNAVKYKGKLLGLPAFLFFPLGWAINTDLIEKEGMKPPHPWPFFGTPEFDNFSWDKLVENFLAVTKRSGDQVDIYADGSNWATFSVQHQLGIFENGGELFDSYDFDEKKVFVNSPESVAVVQRYVDLIVKHKVAAPPGAASAFKEGLWRAQKAVAQSSWFSYNIFGKPEDRGFQWRWIFLPHFGKGRRILQAGDIISANPKSPASDLAAEMAVTFSTDSEYTGPLYDAWQNLPAYDSTAILQRVTHPHIKAETKTYLARYAAYSECKPCTENVKLVPGHQGRAAGFFSNTLRTQVEAVVQGQTTVQQAMDEARKQIEAELAKT